MAVFRIERTRDYTVMSNHHLRNHELSLKAKGLLSMMLSLPDDWNYTTRGLAKICKEGVDAIGNALRELETAGYIVRHQLRDRQGRISDTEYVIYEQPQPRQPETPGPDTAEPDTASPDTENPYMDKPDTEKPAELNIEKSNTQKSITQGASTDSIPFREPAAAQLPERKGRDAMSVSEMESYRDLILENIEYDHLCREFTTYREDLDEIVELMVETVCAKRKTTRIAGSDFPHEVVRSRFLKLDCSHIEFVMECLRNNTTEIRNMKQYLLAVLFNAPKPNLLQCHSSYVVTDPKGSIVIECGNALLKHGYTIKIFNTINFQKSMHYNPFAYIHSEKDILKLVTTLIANTKGDGKAGDEFWTKAETLLYCALIGYIHYEAPVEEQNFSTLIEFLNAMEEREDDEEFQNPVDLMFEALEKKKPNHFAVRQYKKYKLAAGKTAKSILISCGARLAPFDIQEVRDVTAYDELQLDTLGDKKTALFLIMSDTDATFNFLISMIYTQLFNLLCEKADDVYGGRLPVHVRCLIDEMANIGQIPNLEKLVATIRSREISACLVLQAQSQLKAIYKDNADTIIGNMDSRIFLGGSEPTTLKELNQALGKETIDTYNTSNTRGNSPSYGLNYQKLGKDLASVDELAVLDGSKCILQLRGVRPFLSDKYDLTQHPNYKYTSDFDKRNEFNIEQFLSRRLKLKAGDEFVVVDAD